MIAASDGIEAECALPGQFRALAAVEREDGSIDRRFFRIELAVLVGVFDDPPVNRAERNQPERDPARVAAADFDRDVSSGRGIEVDRQRREIESRPVVPPLER